MDKLLKILIVDDDEQLRRSLRRLLQLAAQAVVLEAKNGLEALICLDDQENIKSTFALIISDMEMPGMDGMGLHRELMKRGFPNAKFVMASSGMQGTKRTYVAEQHIRLLQKPVDPEELIALVRDILAS